MDIQDMDPQVNLKYTPKMICNDGQSEVRDYQMHSRPTQALLQQNLSRNTRGFTCN